MMFKIFAALKSILIGSVLVLGPISRCSAAGDPAIFDMNTSLVEASQLFGSQVNPAPLPSAAYGTYTQGCLAGAARLPENGTYWQAMRLSRNRTWGHPIILKYIERLAADAARLDGWPGLLVGDIGQPRGGPMLSGHRSHQIGLDVDIWLNPSPPRRLTMDERETLSADSVVKGPFELNTESWTEIHARLLRRAASYSAVARIFVHPAIKRELCHWAGEDRGWLRKIRAWYGHDDHFHVRLKCPVGKGPCLDQDQPPAGDGCGGELAWWFSPDAYRAAPEKKPPAPLTLDDLPVACRSVLGLR